MYCYRTVEQLRCENPCLYNDITKWISYYNIQHADDEAIVALANIIDRYSSKCQPCVRPSRYFSPSMCYPSYECYPPAVYPPAVCAPAVYYPC